MPGPGPGATGPAGAGGAFAEIRVAGSLRGSMGCFAPGASLTESVASAVRAAARADPRFAPLRPDEVEGALLRISLVGPLRPFGGPASIAPGDGIRVRRHWQRGTLLPGGAPEPGRDATAFLRRACLKAGLPPGAWEAEGTRVDLFSVEELEGGDGP